MLRLLILRHAEAMWKESDSRDWDRPLTDRGEREARILGERLRACDVKPEMILSSSAIRARQTAEMIVHELEYPRSAVLLEDSLYLAESVELYALLREVARHESPLVIVGHNPGVTDLASMLTGDELFAIPTAGMVCLDFEISTWRELAPGMGLRALDDGEGIHE